MNLTNRLPELEDALRGLFATRQIPRDEETIRYWVEDLSSLGIDAAIHAIRSFRVSSSEYPTPAAVRRYAPGIAGLAPDELASMSWGVVRSVCRKFGNQHSIAFEDQAISAAVRAIGGLSAIASADARELGFMAAQFKGAYSAAIRTGVGNGRYLQGVSDQVVLIPADAINDPQKILSGDLECRPLIEFKGANDAGKHDH